MAQIYSEMLFTAPGDIEIHLVTVDENRSRFGFYVQLDGKGSVICEFAEQADLDTCLAFIMSLQQGVPTAGSERVQQVLDSIVAEEGDAVV